MRTPSALLISPLCLPALIIFPLSAALGSTEHLGVVRTARSVAAFF
jgi:hypothetical protein